MAARPNLMDMNDIQLIDGYRFNRRGLQYLEGLLRGRVEQRTLRHNSLSTMEKIIIALRYYATGGVQIKGGDIHQVSQSTVSKVITEVTEALAAPDIIRQFVTFPRNVPVFDRQVQEFAGIAGFPKVIGVIDGTHVNILAPSEDEDMYVNRKGYHSINVQLIFDAFDNIIDVVARWPGSTHDSRILNNSGVRQLFETGVIPAGYHLLGDSGYPCRRWLLTPYLDPQPGSQTSYNRSLKITRSKVERGIGQLKRRFGILHSEIRMKAVKACKIIIGCVVLHNICKKLDIPIPDVQDGNDDQPGPNNSDNEGAPQVGLRYRDYIANMYF